MENQLNVHTQRIPLNGNHVLEIILKGEITFTSPLDVEKILQEQLQDSTQGVLLNFSGLEYVDSTGLGALASLSIKVSGKKMAAVLCEVSPRLSGLIRSCNLHGLLVIMDSREEALNYIKLQRR